MELVGRGGLGWAGLGNTATEIGVQKLDTRPLERNPPFFAARPTTACPFCLAWAALAALKRVGLNDWIGQQRQAISILS